MTIPAGEDSSSDSLHYGRHHYKLPWVPPSSIPKAASALPKASECQPIMTTCMLGAVLIHLAKWGLTTLPLYRSTRSVLCLTCMLLVGRAGCDPTGELQRLALAEGFTPGERLHTISLGQGQGPLAQATIEMAAKQGDQP